MDLKWKTKLAVRIHGGRGEGAKGKRMMSRHTEGQVGEY